MYFNIDIDEQVSHQLSTIAKNRGQSSSTLIREVIIEWLQRHPNQAQWPSTVKAFKGVKDFPPFESYRSELKPPSQDPLV